MRIIMHAFERADAKEVAWLESADAKEAAWFERVDAKKKLQDLKEQMLKKLRDLKEQMLKKHIVKGGISLFCVTIFFFIIQPGKV